jgi:uncharacterized paraquat-inducible protein A
LVIYVFAAIGLFVTVLFVVCAWRELLCAGRQASLRRASERLAAKHCPRCDYDLRGSQESTHCPECGLPFYWNVKWH